MKFSDMKPHERDALIFAGLDLIKDKDPIIIIDPEGYAPFIERLGDGITVETRSESYRATQQEAAVRRRIILEILTVRGELTAREVAAELYRRGHTPSDERNFAAPRLTELKAAGQVKVIGKRKCDYTGRSVAVWAVTKGV